MNEGQISDTWRNNRTALTGHTIEALIIVIFYISRFLRGERSLLYALAIAVLALIPVMLGYFYFFKDRETSMIKHTVGIGFAVTYSVMVLTTTEANIYVLVIPMILLVTVFGDVAFSIKINIGTVILSLIMTIGGAYTGRFGYQGRDGAIVQVTAMVLVGFYSIYSARTSDANNRQKLDNIKKEHDKTEELLTNLSLLSGQLQAGMKDIYEKVDNLNISSMATKDAMTEVGSGTAETANAVQEQIHQTEEIQDKVNLVSTDTDRLSDSMAKMLSVLENAATEMNLLVTRTENTVNEGAAVTDRLNTLDHYIDEMNSIIGLISGIASRTSLLALNASIEAARAGDAGRGFSVVAVQISDMAAQTKSATIHITELIENIAAAIRETITVILKMISAINDEKHTTENAAESFTYIKSNTLEMQGHVEHLSRNLNELMNANMQIINSIETISAISEEVSAHASETISAQEANFNALNQITERMQKLMELTK